MEITAQEVYADTVLKLTPAERFRLASLILDELTRVGAFPAVVDSTDIWTEQDQQDVTRFSLSYAASLYPEDEELT